MSKKRRLSDLTFATTLLLSCAHGAYAATTPAPTATPPAKAAPRAAATHAAAPHAPARRQVVLAVDAEAIDAVGHHIAHGTQNVISADMLARAVPGTNPLQVLATQPGVSFVSDDPQGLNTWSNQFYMHGFMQNQIGMTLDGIPLGDQQYHSYNGLNSIAAISSENVGRMDVSMSAGAESIASTSNLGGSVEYYSSDPKMKGGATIAQTFGSNDMFHTYIRGDSGALNQSGTRFYVSYMRNDTNKWKGGGNMFMQQVNAKFLQPIGESSKFSMYFDWSDLDQYAYQDMSFDMLKNGGYRIDNFVGTPNAYAKAYNSALNANGLGGSLPPGYSKMSDPWDASYYDGATVERDYLGGANLDLLLTDRLRWVSVVYGQGEYGRGTWASPYMSSPSGAPLIDQITVPKTQRFGFSSSLHYDIAHNHIRGGIWYENYHVDVGRYAYNEPVLGQGEPINSLGSLPLPFATLWAQTFNSNSFTAFVQDTYNVLPNVALHFGFKSQLQTVTAGQTGNLPSYTGTDAIAAGSVTTAKAFLPHISGDWHFLRHNELFFDVSENVQSFPIAGYKQGPSPFAVTQSAYNQMQANGGLKPQTDWNYAVGYRYNDRYVQASLYAYHTDFSNRMQQITSGSITNPVSTVANVGSVTMNGVDAGLTITPITGLALYNSISYDHATYGDNLTQISGGQATTYALKGQQVVNYPRFMYKASLSYRWRHADVHVDTNYMGTRNFSYTGDMRTPGYWLESLGARYHFGDMGKYNRTFGFMKNLTFEFNVYNLTNTKYIATTGENGNPMMGDYQSFLVGAPRQYYGTLRAEF
ncbi:TonB-dependent receptor [Gluconacetobacter tumulisoli]|uniref:TonB-dependent receptor n=1 Tax=Gluconacetobacter tumulisoli TaxID=1286189 RepID=A0A7W4K848_9PROT|nr:TonB-dependent receptor [Gluconacetobacter tumulisoli]MBB2202123.1 TonB-dependent receptor [Gluconacetobacter tumulisoli]